MDDDLLFSADYGDGLQKKVRKNAGKKLVRRQILWYNAPDNRTPMGGTNL